MQVLRGLYSAYERNGTWFVEVRSSTASGNPLIVNEENNKLGSNHRVYLSKIGKCMSRVSLLTFSHICEHVEGY